MTNQKNIVTANGVQYVLLDKVGQNDVSHQLSGHQKVRVRGQVYWASKYMPTTSEELLDHILGGRGEAQKMTNRIFGF